MNAFHQVEQAVLPQQPVEPGLDPGLLCIAGQNHHTGTDRRAQRALSRSSSRSMFKPISICPWSISSRRRRLGQFSARAQRHNRLYRNLYDLRLGLDNGYSRDALFELIESNFAPMDGGSLVAPGVEIIFGGGAPEIDPGSALDQLVFPCSASEAIVPACLSKTSRKSLTFHVTPDRRSLSISKLASPPLESLERSGTSHGTLNCSQATS